MPGLYPRIKPYNTHKLNVDTPHVLHIEECGEPSGVPVLFVHGGPGAGCQPYHRTYFDPEAYRVVLFDQRGCGHSTPHAELEGNNTQALIEDMEKIREFLGVEKWVLFGGSWGATLSLLYAQAYPERVLGLILRGVFLSTEAEINWIYRGGAASIFPDHWDEFVDYLPSQERENVLEAYHKRLTGENELARMGAAKAWARWEAQTSTLQPSKSIVSSFTEPHTAMSLSRIECHYFYNHSFLEENQILDNMEKLDGVPGVIVQGRYDIVCPMQSAYALYKAWPDCELDIIPDAGHSATERGIVDALVRTTSKFADRFKPGA